MTTLHQWLAAQTAKHCELCALSLLLNVIQFGLILALHMGA